MLGKVLFATDFSECCIENGIVFLERIREVIEEIVVVYVVDEKDIEVYKWGETGSLDLRETVSLSSFDPVYGKVVLSEAPASTYDVVTATYYYYPREIDENLIPEAVACLAAFYYVMREFLLIPERLSHGAYRFSHARPYMVLLDQYYRIRDIMLGKIHTKGEHDEPSLIRTELK